MATSGKFTTGVKCAPPIAPWFEMVNVPPFISSAVILRSRAFAASLLQFLREIEHGFFIHVANHGNHQALLGVHGDAEVDVFLDNDFVRHFIEARIENRMLLERRGDRFQDERRERELDAFLFVIGRKFFPQFADAREINIVELRDARDGAGAFGHAARNDLAQRRDRLLENRSPLREINLQRRWLRRSAGRGRRGFGGSLLQLGDVSPHVARNDASAGFAAADFGQVNSQFARHPAQRRRRHGRGHGRRILFRSFLLVLVLVLDWFRRGCSCGGSFFRRRFRRCFSRRRSAAPRQRNQALSDTHFVAGFHVNFFHDAGGGGWNRSDGLFIFQLQDRLVFGHGVAFFHKNADNDAGIGAFAQLGKFYIHKSKREDAAKDGEYPARNYSPSVWQETANVMSLRLRNLVDKRSVNHSDGATMKTGVAKFFLRLAGGMFLTTCVWQNNFAACAEEISAEAKTNFEWFGSLGFPDVKGCPFVRVTRKWWDSKGKWPAQSDFANGFLLTGDSRAFEILDLQIFKCSYQATTTTAQVQIETSYAAADLKSEAGSLLERIQSLKAGEDLFPRRDERMSQRARTFVLAWACWRNGLDEDAEKLFQASKKLRDGIEAVDGNFQLVLEKEIACAVMWRAVVDFGDVSITRPQLLHEFARFIKCYPHSEYQERARQTVAMLTRMVAEDEAHARTAPTNLAALPVDARVRELLFELRDQHGEQSSQPGWCDIFDDWRGVTNSPAHQLVSIGYPAVPQLIAVLEDTTFTRSVGYWCDFTFSHQVLTVGDCSLAILGRITGKYFYVANHSSGDMSTDEKAAEARKLAEAWWTEFQEKGEQQMLIEGTAAGDDSAKSEAELLVARFPAAAAPALARGIHAATKEWTRNELIKVFRKFDTSAALAFLKGELHAGTDGSRVSAAEALLEMQSNKQEVVNAMIQEWQNSPDYKVENDQGWTECARFLAAADSPEAIEALARHLPARPISTRMAIVHNVGEGGTRWGEIREISKRGAVSAATEALLAGMLEDAGQQLGDSGPRLGRHFRDVRICDMAGYYLNQLWPDRYHFDLSTSSESRDEQRDECKKIWSQNQKQ